MFFEYEVDGGGGVHVLIRRASDIAGPATCWWSRTKSPPSRKHLARSQSSKPQRRLTARSTSTTITNWQVRPPQTLSNASRLSGRPISQNVSGPGWSIGAAASLRTPSTSLMNMFSLTAASLACTRTSPRSLRTNNTRSSSSR